MSKTSTARALLMRSVRAVTFLASAGFLCAAGTAHAVTYRASLLDVPQMNADTMAVAIFGTSIVGTRVSSPSFQYHASIWQNGLSVDLHPPAYQLSQGYSVFGNQQVGMAHKDDKQHAMLWSGSAASAIDLHPVGFVASSAVAISATRQAGWASLNVRNEPFHAIIWNGSASDYIDLNPPGYQRSVIHSMFGDLQVGVGLQEPANNRHAMLWRGTAASAIDLNPPGFIESSANAIVGDMQIGQGYSTSHRALLWKGSPQSVVDITPSGFSESLALNGSEAGQVGYGSGEATGGASHALFWNGTAESAIDLHNLLTDLPISLAHSYAVGINENGVIVGYAQDTAFRNHAIIWQVVPEPDSFGLAASVAAFASIRARRRHMHN